MATIRKRGASFQCQLRIQGHQAESRSFTTRAAAKSWAERREAELKGGSIKVPTSVTLRSLLEEYLGKTTNSGDKSFIKTFMNRCDFLEMPVAKLTSAHFLTFRDEQLKTMKPSSYNRSIKPIVGAFKYAIEYKRFPADCADCVKTTKLRAKTTKRRRRFWPEEEERFLAACPCPIVRAVLTILVETAMRSGELFLARKAMVMSGFIYLPTEDTKTKDPRTVALSPRALSAVEVLKAASACDKLVPISKCVLKVRFRKVRDAVGLGDLHIHDLRHEALSRLSESGLFGPAELMAMSGHKQLTQLGDYIHSNPQMLRQKLLQLDQIQRQSPTSQTHLNGSNHPPHSSSDRTLLAVQPTLALAG